MAREYLVEVFGCHNLTALIIQADDIEFSVIKKLADRVTEASTNLCQPRIYIREAVKSDKGRLEDE